MINLAVFVTTHCSCRRETFMLICVAFEIPRARVLATWLTNLRPQRSEWIFWLYGWQNRVSPSLLLHTQVRNDVHEEIA